MIRTASNIRRRGMAMILVMIAMTVSSVLVLAMLNSGAVHAQVGASSAVRLQAQLLAESGLNLAIYYLKNPAASPISLVYGANGNVHYPGETGISISGLPGTIDLAITNPANGNFQIVSTGTFDGTSVTANSTLQLNKSKQFTYGGYFQGSVSLNAVTSITGGVITNGSLQQLILGQVQGSSTTASTGSATDRQNTDFTYPISMFHYLPTYFYQGKSYQAQELTSNFTGGALNATSATNPCNVWYVTRSNIAISGTTIVNGSLITMPGIGLKVSGNLTVTPTPNLPALVVGKDLTYTAANTSVNSNGPTYLAGQLKGSATGSSPLNSYSVNGVFLGVEGGFPVASNYKGSITLKWVQQKAKTVAFADQMEDVQSVTAQAWDTDNARPQ